MRQLLNLAHLTWGARTRCGFCSTFSTYRKLLCCNCKTFNLWIWSHDWSANACTKYSFLRKATSCDWLYFLHILTSFYFSDHAAIFKLKRGEGLTSSKWISSFEHHAGGGGGCDHVNIDFHLGVDSCVADLHRSMCTLLSIIPHQYVSECKECLL